jgi:hypothetical protein
MDATVADLLALVSKLRANLPKTIDIKALGVIFETPVQILWTRGSLIWRTEELARTACEALERGDFTVAAILARSIDENAALIWQILEALQQRHKYTLDQFSQLLMRMLSGSKSDQESPKPLHILECLRHIDKKIPGFFAAYESLSEFAHPNWSGSSGLYSILDKETRIVHFGRGLDEPDVVRGFIIYAMIGSLGAFDYAYDLITDLMPSFLDELESIYADAAQSARSSQSIRRADPN